MLRFPYLPVALHGPPSPSLPVGSVQRWRPFRPARILGPTGLHRAYSRCLLDSGADETLFPLSIAAPLGVRFRVDLGQSARWGRQRYAVQFADVELELTD